MVATLSERGAEARLNAPGTPAAAPVSSWDWLAVASVVIPGLALLVIALA